MMKFENTAVAVRIKEYNDSLLYRDVKNIWESLQKTRREYFLLRANVEAAIVELKNVVEIYDEEI
jgi:hypothetical protein